MTPNDSHNTNSHNSNDSNMVIDGEKIRRSKITRACDACQRRKCKCDGEAKCGPCGAKNIACVYSLPVKKRGPKALKNLDVTVKAIRYDLIEYYFQYVNPYHPVIHKDRFYANIHLASPYLLAAMYAIAMPYAQSFAPDAPTTLFNAGDEYYKHAREIMDQYLDNPDVWTVSATILVSLYSTTSGRESYGWLLQGTATRLAQLLGLHNDPKTCYSKALSVEEMEERRCIWWTCYELDRYGGGLSGKPMTISEDEFNVHLPKYKKWDPESEVHYCIPTNAHAFFVILLQIYTKILKYCRTVMSPCKMSLPDPQQMLCLDEALLSWYTALPPWMHSYRDASESGRTPHSVFYRAYIHVFYHISCILVRAPSLTYLYRTQPTILEFDSQFLLVKMSADAITGILKDIMEQNPEFYRLSPFLSLCVTLAGLVHSISGFSEETLEFHIKVLHSIGRVTRGAISDAQLLKSLKNVSLDRRLDVLIYRIKRATGCPMVNFFKSSDPGPLLPHQVPHIERHPPFSFPNETREDIQDVFRRNKILNTTAFTDLVLTNDMFGVLQTYPPLGIVAGSNPLIARDLDVSLQFSNTFSTDHTFSSTRSDSWSSEGPIIVASTGDEHDGCGLPMGSSFDSLFPSIDQELFKF